MGEIRKTNDKILERTVKSLIVSQAKRRLVTPQTSQVVKQIICSCGILSEARQLFKTSPSIVHQGKTDTSFVQDRRTKSTDSPAVDVTTPVSQALFKNPKGPIEQGNPNTFVETKLCLILFYSGSTSSLL